MSDELSDNNGEDNFFMISNQPNIKFESKSIANQISKEPITETLKYEYNYTLNLLKPGEDGLIESYLTENYSDMEKENRTDISDWFNFGLNEEKWIKLLNKSIYMHYEKYLINLSKQEKLNASNNNLNTQSESQTANQIKELNKANAIPGFNPMTCAMGNMSNIPTIPGQMGNFMPGNMAAAAAMGNFPFNMMRPGMPFMQMNPQMAAKMMGKMNPNTNFPQ